MARSTVSNRLEQLLNEFPGPVQLAQRRRYRHQGLWPGLLAIMGGLWISVPILPDWARISLQNRLPDWARISSNYFSFIGFGFLCVGVITHRIEMFFFLISMNILRDLAIPPPPVRHYELWRIYVSIIAMIYGVFLAATSMLAPDAGSLVLDSEGFWINGYFGMRHRRTWMETSNFRVEERNAFSSIVVYDNATQAPSKVGKILSALWDRRSALHGPCDLMPETLALLMTQWRERALQR
jgi:hypothetical protein